MAIPTDFSVTTANVKPIANPKPPIDGPQAKDAQPTPATPAPEAKDAQPEAVTPAPQVLTANPADPSVPPFPLNHARILYDNAFADATASASIGSTPGDALLPNTFLSWTFNAVAEGANITLTVPVGVTIDTIAIGAHTLNDVSNTVRIETSTTDVGAFTLQEERSISSNDAIMWHTDTPIAIRRVRITAVNATGFAKVGVIYAGVALQMQRPFFGGSTPMNENRTIRYYDAWSESGNLIARSRRAVNIENSFSWNNIKDSWYRTYFQPFRDVAEELPFFIAWNLLEYPNDVAFALGQNFDTSYSGTRSLRTISFDAKGTP